MYQKMKVLIHQRLDESITLENKDKIVGTDNDIRKIPPKELDDILRRIGISQNHIK